MPQRRGRVTEYNREYMRRWRSDPERRARERLRNAERWRRQERARKLARSQDPNALASGGRRFWCQHKPSPGICQICGRRAATESIERLELGESGKFVPVILTWCGVC